MAKLGTTMGFKVTIEETKSAPDVKVGDVVHVRATIAGIRCLDAFHGGVVELAVRGADSFETYANEIVHVEPRPLQVGDTVDLRSGTRSGAQGRVVAVAGNAAWVQWPERSHPYTYKTEQLERVA